MNEKLVGALDCIDERHVIHAARRRHRKKVLLTAVAAVLALVFFWQAPSIPLVISAEAVSLAPDSRLGERPSRSSEKFDPWRDRWNLQRDRTEGMLPGIKEFTRECSRNLLPGTENQAWSPVNAYIGLAMTAELTAGTTREQVLQVLGTDGLEQLRSGVSAVWETAYTDNHFEICMLANSLWLDQSVNFRQETMDGLSQHYYADVYQGKLGSRKTNKAMGRWIRNHTGGFLRDGIPQIQPGPGEDPVMTLMSTIYFRSKWVDAFQRGNNTEDLFHSPDGDRTVTYMNAKEMQMYYYWGEDFGAVALLLENGSTMWLILPDEDKTVEDVLQRGEYMEMITRQPSFAEAHSKDMKVNLSLPKFDVQSTANVRSALEAMGMEEIFRPSSADFTPTVQDDLPVFLSSVIQQTRVAIDEEGVTAASYIVLPGAGASAPPEEIIDFILNRPFLFAITNREEIPMFLGAVQKP